jgi:hypothetical protein
MAIANRRVQSGWRAESNPHCNGVAKPDGDGNRNADNNSNSHGHRNGDAYTNSNGRATGDTDTQASSNPTTSRVSWRALNG